MTKMFVFQITVHKSSTCPNLPPHQKITYIITLFDVKYQLSEYGIRKKETPGKHKFNHSSQSRIKRAINSNNNKKSI